MFWFFFIFIFYGIAFGVLSAIAVKNKNRDQAGWFFIGFLFGVFGLIAALIVDQIAPPNPHNRPLHSLIRLHRQKNAPISQK